MTSPVLDEKGRIVSIPPDLITGTDDLLYLYGFSREELQRERETIDGTGEQPEEKAHHEPKKKKRRKKKRKKKKGKSKK